METHSHLSELISTATKVIGAAIFQSTVWVTHWLGEEYDIDCVTTKFPHSNVCIMIWRCIMWGNKGPMVVFDYPKGEGITGEHYQDQILGKVLFKYYRRMSRTRGKIYFQQDGASPHWAIATQEILKENNINVFSHPPSSPDLNPIEQMWHILKEHIRKHHGSQQVSRNSNKLCRRPRTQLLWRK